MKEKLEKKLEEMKKEHDKHIQNLQNLDSARERCIAVINGTKGKISVLE